MTNKNYVVGSASVLIALSILFVSNAYATPFCDGNSLYDNITINGNEIDVLIDTCETACFDESLLGLGQAGCQENETVLAILIIVVGLGVFSLVAWVIKR